MVEITGGGSRCGFPKWMPSTAVSSVTNILPGIIEPRRQTDALAVTRRITSDLRIGDDTARDHSGLVTGQHRRFLPLPPALLLKPWLPCWLKPLRLPVPQLSLPPKKQAMLLPLPRDTP